MSNYYRDAAASAPASVFPELNRHLNTLADIADALMTGERGDNLVAVAREACRAEQELADLRRHVDAVAPWASLWEIVQRGLNPPPRPRKLPGLRLVGSQLRLVNHKRR